MPTDSKRSRSYRKDDDGTAGEWKRRNEPAHIDPKPTIAPGKLRPCEDCGELCDPSIFDGMCDGCADDADAGCDGPEEGIGADPEPDDE